jgi:hypothetical protein
MDLSFPLLLDAFDTLEFLEVLDPVEYTLPLLEPKVFFSDIFEVAIFTFEPPRVLNVLFLVICLYLVSDFDRDFGLSSYFLIILPPK